MAKAQESKPLQVLGLGNPLLDIVTEVPKEFIDKYDLKLNNMYLAQPHQMPIYSEIQKSYPFHYIPGGATLNSMRFCQALYKKGHSVMYSGCIGDDKEGEAMKNLLKGEGLTAFFEVHQTIPTGLCAVLCSENDRALCTNLGASGKFTYDYFEASILSVLPQVDIIYSAAYFLSSSPKTMLYCAQHCAKNNKIYALGLAAVFMVETMVDEIQKLLPYTDLLIGNKEEFLTLARVTGLNSENIEDIVRVLVDYPPKVNKLRSRIIIATQDSNSIIVGTSWPTPGAKITTYPVVKLPPSKVVDANGSGDAFVGGLLYGLAYKKSLDESIYYAIQAATQVVQKRGALVSSEELSQIPAFEDFTRVSE